MTAAERARPRRTCRGRRPRAAARSTSYESRRTSARRRRRRRPSPARRRPRARRHGPDDRHDATRSRCRRSTPTAPARRPPQSNAVTPLAAVAPSAPTRRERASPASQSARVSWTAPSSDGDSPITGYTVTPYVGAQRPDARAGRALDATSTTVTGLTNGTAYTFQVTATNAVGHERRLGGLERRDAGARRSSTSPRPTTLDGGDTSAGRARRQVPDGLRRHGHRRALLQGGGEHRHARRQPVDRGRDAARARDVHRRDGRPAGSTCSSPAR